MSKVLATRGRGGTVGGDEENKDDEQKDNEEIDDVEMVQYEPTDPDELVEAAQRSQELENFLPGERWGRIENPDIGRGQC